MKYENRMESDQLIGGIVNEVNVHREKILNQNLFNISLKTTSMLNEQDTNLLNAMNEIGKVIKFIGDPSKIIGSQKTKHGEIAENVEVCIGNAKQLIKGLPQSFSFDGVGRTAPEDFIMDGIKMQSKFLNSENNTLSAIIEHLDKYKNINFGRDGSKYVIPKDFYATINSIRNGETVSGLSSKTVRIILKKVSKIENKTGKNFDDVVKSSISTYKDVQQGNIVNAIDLHKENINKENIKIKENIKKNAENNRREAIIKSKPSINEAVKTSAISALAEGTIQTALVMLKKRKSLKNYDIEDWKEVGIVFGKSSGKGAVRGISIYGLTNYASMPAPLAASFVSATFGVSTLYSSYKNGEISAEGMVERGEILCFDTTLNLLGSAMGQALIPIPVLGAVIGSIASNVLSSIVKEKLDKHEKKLIKLSKMRYEENIRMLDKQLAKDIEKMVKKMTFMWGISRMAFNYENNVSLRFDASQKLAIAHEVPNNKILKNEKDVDDYFLN